MGADQRRWYQVGRKPRRKDGDRGTHQGRTIDRPQPQSPTPPAHQRSTADGDGAMVARSQVVVSGSTATLLGTLTNETGCDVHFSGLPPYAVMVDVVLDTAGSPTILFGDFNSPPRERPSTGDWVMHPGATVPYRSLPFTLKAPDPQWDGGDWCTASRSTMLDAMMFDNPRELLTVHLVA